LGGLFKSAFLSVEKGKKEYEDCSDFWLKMLIHMSLIVIDKRMSSISSLLQDCSLIKIAVFDKS